MENGKWRELNMDDQFWFGRIAYVVGTQEIGNVGYLHKHEKYDDN